MLDVTFLKETFCQWHKEDPYYAKIQIWSSDLINYFWTWGDDRSFHFSFICGKELHWLSLRHKICNLMALNTKYSVVPKLMAATADHCFNLKNWSLSYFSHLINKFCTSKLSSNCKDFASYLFSLGMAWGSF